MLSAPLGLSVMAASGGQQRPRNQRVVGIVAGILVVIIGLVSVSVVLLAGDDTDPEPQGPQATQTAEPSGPPAQIAFRPVLEALPKTAVCSKPDVWCTRTPETTGAYRLGPAAVRTPDIVEAAARLSDYGAWVVGITLSDEGATRFEAVTRELADNAGARAQLAIVVDGVVISAPVVQTPIPGAEVDISADFSQSAAERLAASLNP
jgi:preprotein translocase subunit SecD